MLSPTPADTAGTFKPHTIDYCPPARLSRDAHKRKSKSDNDKDPATEKDDTRPRHQRLYEHALARQRKANSAEERLQSSEERAAALCTFAPDVAATSAITATAESTIAMKDDVEAMEPEDRALLGLDRLTHRKGAFLRLHDVVRKCDGIAGPGVSFCANAPMRSLDDAPTAHRACAPTGTTRTTKRLR